MRSNSLISRSYLHLFPCLVGILFVNKPVGFFSLRSISIHFLLVERDCWNPLEEMTHSRVSSFKLSQTETIINQNILNNTATV